MSSFASGFFFVCSPYLLGMGWHAYFQGWNVQTIPTRFMLNGERIRSTTETRQAKCSSSLSGNFHSKKASEETRDRERDREAFIILYGKNAKK